MPARNDLFLRLELFFCDTSHFSSFMIPNGHVIVGWLKSNLLNMADDVEKACNTFSKRIVKRDV